MGKELLAYICSIARRHGRDPRDLGDGIEAFDIAVDTIERVLRLEAEDAPTKWREGVGSLRGFLFTIGRRRLLDHLRRSRHRKVTTADCSVSEVVDEADVDASKQEAREAALLNLLQETAARSTRVAKIIEAAGSGDNPKPRHLAAATGIRRKTIYKLLDDLRKRARTIFEEEP